MARRSTPKSNTTARGGAPARADQNVVLAVALIVAAVFVVYGQVTSHEFTNFDDNLYISENPVVQQGLTAAGVRWAFTNFDINWHPLTWITYMIDVDLFGARAGRIALINVLFHLANSLLVFFVLKRATGALARSAIVALLFAVHPLHVESVAWISERKDVLSGLFFLLTIWFHVDWAQTRSRLSYGLSILMFALGLLSKGMVVTLPFVLLLLDWWPLARFDRRAIIEKLPHFGLTAFGIWITLKGQEAINAVVQTAALPFGARASNAIVSYAAYLRKTIWPSDLAIPYPYHQHSALVVIVSIVVLLAITAFVLMQRQRRYLATGWLWFVGMLVPVIGLVQIGVQAMADRYTYLPHIGLFIAVVWLVADLAEKRDTLRQPVQLATLAAIVALFIVAMMQTRVWRNTETLFANAVTKTEGNAIAHNNLGTALLKQGRFADALPQFEAAVAADPKYDDARAGLGGALIGVGRVPDAEREFRRVLQSNPRHAAARNDLAGILSRTGREAEAVQQYEEALRLDPKQYDAHMSYGALLSRMNRNDEAMRHFAAAADVRPSSPEPHIYLALIYAQSNRFAEAMAEAQRAKAIDPVRANDMLTNAVRMPPSASNLDQFIVTMNSRR